MLRRIATSIETTVAKYKTNEDDPELLDTEEQKELIDNLRIDNEKSTRFHREALKLSGFALASIKMLCALLQILIPGVLPMHESVQDYFSSTIIVFLEIYAAACCTYFALYVNSMTLQNYYWRVSFGLVSLFGVEFLIGVLWWWPEFVVPLWFGGTTLLYASVILYADMTLKSTAKDIEQLKGMMYPFKKL